MNKDTLPKIAFGASIGLLIFAYGVTVGLYEVFPFRAIKFGVDSVQEVLREYNTLLGIRPDHFLSPSRRAGSGVTQSSPDAIAPGLTLLTGFFDESNELRLIRADGSIVNRWRVSFSEAIPERDHIQPSGNAPATDWNIDLHGALALPDGSVVFNFEYGGLVKMDRCGEVQWTVPLMTHHFVDPANDGGFWVGGRRYVESESRFRPVAAPYLEDTILKISADGEVLKEISVLGLIFRNGLEPVLLANGNFSVETRDLMEVVHLNDVEELTEELAPLFPDFAAGDLLVSLRNYNLVLVLDPETETVKWHQTGPWIRQHDPDFTKHGMISVFDNRTDGGKGRVFGGSNIVQMNPQDRSTSVVFGAGPGEDMYTAVRGRHQYLDNENKLITDYESGRVLEVSESGEIVWEFINRFDEDRVAHVNDAIRYSPGYFELVDWSCEN